MGFLENLKKNNFQTLSERAISNLQNKENQQNQASNKKIEKLSSNEASGITKRDTLSKAGFGNVDMGRREVEKGNENYFKNNFINPNKKIIGESMGTSPFFKNVTGSTKEILESMILQEGLTDLIRNHAGKIATAGTLAAGVAAGHALSGGDFDFNKDNQSNDQAQPNKSTNISNSGDALKQAKDMHYNENVKTEKVDYNQKKGWGDAFNEQMDRSAIARNNQEYYDKLKDAEELKSNKNPDWFSTGEKVGMGAVGTLGVGALGAGLMAKGRRRR